MLVLLLHFIGTASMDEKTLDSLIKAAPTTYLDINEVLKPIRSDTLQMRHFIQKAKAKNYLDGQAYAYIQIGRVYRDISQYPKAISAFQQARALALEANNVELRIFSLNMLSVVFRRTEAVKSALDYSQAALELAEGVTEKSLGIKRSINVSLNNIGNIYQVLEQYDLAISKFKQALDNETALGNITGMAINHQNIGECYEAVDSLDLALENFRKSLAYNEENNSEGGKIICTYSIAHVYVHLKRVNEAIQLLENSLSKAVPMGDQKIIASIYINLGWAQTHAGNFKSAEQNLLEALNIATTYNFTSEIAEANKFLSELWLKQDNFKKAMEYYQASKTYEDQLTNTRNIMYVNDLVVKYEAEKSSEQIEKLLEQKEEADIQLRKNRTMILIGGVALSLLAGMLYIFYKQYNLSNEKKLLTLEQNMLRSQMNPHFLFNSLNSIKLYIINNEQKNAVHYLNKFSKLVRKILEASSQREISLADELETVELYMNIENIRFSNEINFKIKIEDGIDIHTVKIPSLILQPFLENALWHGLSSKNGDKNITLEVRKLEKGFITIVITDNGVGRDAAEKIKERKVLKRKSVGIDITKERLSNFSKDYQNSFQVQIVDLYNEKNLPSGTKIILNIPTI